MVSEVSKTATDRIPPIAKSAPVFPTINDVDVRQSFSWNGPNNQAAAWLALYFCLNLGLTLYNKAVMHYFKFPYPWTLTGIHTLCGAIGCQLLSMAGVFNPARLNTRESLIMLAFSTLYTINIAVSNISLKMVSVPFHQTIRAMVPLFTMLIEFFWLNKSASFTVALTMLPIIFGVTLATIGDYDFTILGFILTLLGALLAAIKGVTTNIIQVGKLKLHPLDLLLWMTPLAFVQTMSYAFITGELHQVSEFLRDDVSISILLALLANGFIAFGLNVSSFTANKKTSALTMGVAGNVKQVLSIILSVSIFNLTFTLINGVGIFLTLVGGALYTYADVKDRKRPGSPTNSPVYYTKVKHDDDSLMLPRFINEK
ncbi:hypothetical protein BASA50_010042 [Batrachochytrium salamandrivorans]|uniref:Sugar phosphate transporter domain-containing protein n=1 Tax=Batrachochytrium salamandrivorans TaxID=1357716 RepID=A0ABQ8EZJ5_9FUNG|nr:hypothetical protein BASA50_010042 [Batrachochytrium salamandrivorans]